MIPAACGGRFVKVPGEDVGDVVGEDVGDVVGEDVGDVVGEDVGDVVGEDVGEDDGARTSCWVTHTLADFADPVTFTTVSATAAPVGTLSAAPTRVQVVGLTADADPPLQDRKDPLLLNHDTVICAFAPLLALTSEANVQVSPGLTVSRGSRMRVVVPVEVTRAAYFAAT